MGKRSAAELAVTWIKVVEGAARDAGQAAPGQSRKRRRGLFDMFNRPRAPQPIPTPDNLPGGLDFAKLTELYELLKAQQPAQAAGKDNGAGAQVSRVYQSETVPPGSLEGTDPKNA